MFKFATILFLFLIFSESKSQIVINEIMFNPESDMPEWVELYNSSKENFSTDTLLFSDLKYQKSITEFELRSHSYCILCKDSNKFREFWSIPTYVKIYEFPLPGLNNDKDGLSIRTSAGLIDTAFYKGTWADKGISLERIDSEKEFSELNSKSSIDNLGATPGEKNSNSFDDLTVASRIENYVLTVDIQNCGEKEFEDVKLQVKCGEIEFKKTIEKFEINETKHINFDLKEHEAFPAILDWQECEASINPQDDFIFNDTSRIDVYFSYPKNTFTINEIMFDCDDEYAEFIEIYNHRDERVNLYNYRLFDEAEYKKDKGIRIDSVIYIEANSYFVFYFEENFPNNYPDLDLSKTLILSSKFALNNSGDMLVMRDPAEFVQDSLYYKSNWHTRIDEVKNVSIEKKEVDLDSKEKDNWQSSWADENATPTKENSIDPGNIPDNIKNRKVEISPNPLITSRDNSCNIEYFTGFSQAYIRIKLFDIQGVEIANISNGSLQAGAGHITWEPAGLNIATGSYILLFDAFDANSNEKYSEKKILVIAR